MSKNLKKLLETLKIEDIDTLIGVLTSDEDNEEVITGILKKSQEYAKPFLETEFNTKLDTERKTWKGKYFQDAARQANKIFGNLLTNKEIEDVMKDPANEGNTYQAVIDLLKEKAGDNGSKTDAELKKMLELANNKLSDAERKLIETEENHKKAFDDYVKNDKLNAALEKKLVEVLQTITPMNATKAAQLLKDPLTKKALVKLNDRGDINLFDLANPDSQLKKSDTELQTLEGLVKDLADEYELPKLESGGAKKVDPIIPNPQPNNTKFLNSALAASEQLAEAMGS
jgi:hypothetical protein